MFKLLIVDDEIYVLRAMRKSVDFAALGFDEVHQAMGAKEAMALLQEHPIDLIICDIEMPGINGLELIEWVGDRYPGVETIFLTGHAEFAYAKKAVQLGSFEYLLKPVKPEDLAATVTRALDQIREERKAASLVETSQKYRTLWERQKSVVVEKYWQNLLAGRLAPAQENLQAVNLPLRPQSKILPILISVERWHKEFSLRDEDTLEYAIRNAAAELLLGGFKGDIIKDENGILFALVYESADRSPDAAALEEACRAYTNACSQYFYCSVSCYIGHAVPFDELMEVYHRLIELEQENLSSPLSVQQLDAPSSTGSRQKHPLAIPWSDWVILFETGNKAELFKRLDQLFADMQEAQADTESASALYHALVYMIYHVAHKNGLSVKEWTGLRERSGELTAIRSIAQLKAWSEKLIETGSRYLEQQRRESSMLIEKTKQFVKTHLKDVTREKAASHIHLNSAYLSRIFKRETGQSLMDYIIQVKMDRAKILLTETNLRIVDVCEEIGYENYSHFGQVFKKKVGIAPLEFRKRFQKLNLS
ncbi:response regulator transcription factor [Paenibacillus koleovorans]|uniref:response regulator transcription factor n=1 Tax=Paenibacillus koleovorans TaxID=121608 RepID=UPI000FD9C108|nr:response regulator [Paenibacillus koleovorans]